MDFTFKDSEIEKFAEKIQYIPEWFQQFFLRIHKKDKSSEYYKGCFATLRFILKFRKSTDKDRVIFYSLPCLSKLILDKLENDNDNQEKQINNNNNNDNDVNVEEIFKDLVLNINYVYKGNTDIEDIDLDKMFKKMQENSLKEHNKEEQTNEEEQKKYNSEIQNNKNENNQKNLEKCDILSQSNNIEVIELDGDIIKDDINQESTDN